MPPAATLDDETGALPDADDAAEAEASAAGTGGDHSTANGMQGGCSDASVVMSMLDVAMVLARFGGGGWPRRADLRR